MIIGPFDQAARAVGRQRQKAAPRLAAAATAGQLTGLDNEGVEYTVIGPVAIFEGRGAAPAGPTEIELLTEIRDEHTFVMVTHNIAKGLEWGTRLMIIENGRVAYEHAAGVDHDAFSAV